MKILLDVLFNQTKFLICFLITSPNMMMMWWSACNLVSVQREKSLQEKYLIFIFKINLLKDQIYHFKCFINNWIYLINVSQRRIISINSVVTSGNAGYLVLKLAGGQGDHSINLPFGSLMTSFLSVSFVLLGRKPSFFLFLLSCIFFF